MNEENKEKLCSCGCGRPVGEGLYFLSDYCYHNKTNDEESGSRRKNAHGGKGKES